MAWPDAGLPGSVGYRLRHRLFEAGRTGDHLRVDGDPKWLGLRCTRAGRSHKVLTGHELKGLAGLAEGCPGPLYLPPWPVLGILCGFNCRLCLLLCFGLPHGMLLPGCFALLLFLHCLLTKCIYGCTCDKS